MHLLLKMANLVALLFLCAVATASAINIPNVIIRPGIAMPMVGSGSCCGSYNISSWIQAGGRHIDTSCDYGSEPDVAAALQVVLTVVSCLFQHKYEYWILCELLLKILARQASGLKRSDYWVTSKIDPEDYGPDVATAIQSQVLNPLQLDYVDLILMRMLL